MNPPDSPMPRILFVTGRLAEPSLKRVLSELAPRAEFIPEVAVLPISVAALMPPRWIARHLTVPPEIDRIIVPGHCRGDLTPIIEKAAGRPVERGPEDLYDLPGHFGRDDARLRDYGAYDIEILAEINHAPRLTLTDIIDQANRYRAEGANLIDLGCDPDGPWSGVGDAVRALRDEGHRVSIDSFDRAEVTAAAAAGAELVLSVQKANREAAADWGLEVVAIPDVPGTLEGLDETVEWLDARGIPHRVDPVLEPIGFGFAASLGRYLEVRRRYPDAEMLMGVGNLTELTDVDSSGVNVLLTGFCQELGIRSVLTTAVIPWARSSVRELDLARRLCRHAVTHRTLPKHVEPRLVILRDGKSSQLDAQTLVELQARIKDPNWRVFVEDGRIYALNHENLLIDVDPFIMFEKMNIVDPSHAFYLGYELMKAKTALTLSKVYRQDQALDWGFLTEPEVSHRSRRNSPATEDNVTDAPVGVTEA